ncbi:MAG: hypothetical protein Q8P33_03530, partial [bacterium]|nr:hypothetical protein [bacterium]
GGVWQNMDGGSSPELVISIPQGTLMPGIGFDLNDRPHTIFGWGANDVGHRRWVPSLGPVE